MSTFSDPVALTYDADTAWSYTADYSGIAHDGGTYTSNNPNGPAGTQVAFVKNNGLLNQIWSASAGTYTLSFQAAQRGSGNDSAQQLRVTLRPSGSAISTKTFLWCGNQICEERDSTGANVTKRFFAEGFQSINPQLSTISLFYYSRDHLGSVREVTGSNGLVRGRYDYDAWGNQIAFEGKISVDFGYTGHYFHQPSGLNLAMYRAYSPTLGRWISRDPIGEEGGLNLYDYVLNTPINRVDLLGLIDAWPGPAPGEINTLPRIPILGIPGRKVQPPFIPDMTFPVGGCSLAFEACVRNCATEYGTCPANEYDQHSRCEKRCKTLYEYCKDTQR